MVSMVVLPSFLIVVRKSWYRLLFHKILHRFYDLYSPRQTKFVKCLAQIFALTTTLLLWIVAKSIGCSAVLEISNLIPP